MSGWKRAAVAFASLISLLVVALFAGTFVAGWVTGLSGASTVIALASVAGFVFVAPFTYVLFERIVRYAESGGESA